MSTVKMRMSICLKGLRKPRFWRKNLKGLFSLGGRDMTDAEVIPMRILASHYHSDCAISRSPAHLGAARLIRTLLILTKV